MDKKITRNIIIAIVVIALLGAAYFFVMKWDPQKSEDDTPKTATTSDIVVVSLSLNELKSIEVSNSDGKFEIVKDGVNYSMTGYADDKLSSAGLTSPFVKLERIVAKREITDNVNLEDYGFTDPRASVTVTKTDGSKVELVIGNPDPTLVGYYVKTNLSDSVYLVEEQRLSVFFADVNDFKNMHIGDFDFASLESFELYKGNEKITSIRLRNETDTITDIVIEQHIMTHPYYEYVSLNELSVPFDGLGSIDAIEEVSDSLSDMSSYGIGAYTVKIKDGYGAVVLKLGNRSEDGNVYAVREGVNSVYKISGKWLDAVENFVPFDYLYKLTNVYMINTVSKLSFVCPEGEYKLERNDNKYFINGKETTEQIYKDIYTVFVSMAFTGDGKNAKQGTEIGRLTFTFNDGTEASSVYYEADDRNYLVVKSDGAKYLVLKKNFDPVFETVSGLLK